MLKLKENNIYQFKITLCEIEPKIWRRIQIPGNYNFYKLHLAIQHAMGWTDSHLHQFTMFSPKTQRQEVVATQFDDSWGLEKEIIDEKKEKINQYFSLQNKKAVYEYDFGDDWMHDILLEKILPAEDNIKYPLCIAGARACPPEDCGGIWGYQSLLEILKDKRAPEYEEVLEWVGNDYDPEVFDSTAIKFYNR